jgi:hypothetical protein
MELEEEYQKFLSEHEALTEQGKKLIPSVLAHFNNYVVHSINPSLPEEFSLIQSDNAFYSNGKFFVTTGIYQTPSGPTKGPLGIERIVMNLLDRYKKQTPWIDNIWEGFSLSR